MVRTGVWFVALGLLVPTGATAQFLEGEDMPAERLTTEKKRELAEAKLKEIKGALGFALKSLEQAQTSRDFVMMGCVNENLGVLKGLVKVSEDAEVNLREAAARRDTGLINHEFKKIMIASNRAKGFRTQVEGCAGESRHHTGGTEKETTEDEEIREDDPAVRETDALSPLPTEEQVTRPDPPTAWE